MGEYIIPVIKQFITNEKIGFSISEDTKSKFWLDDNIGDITVRFEINNPRHEIFYDVFSIYDSSHLREETIEDVIRLDVQAEENRKWNLEENIEDIFLILDQVKLWAMQNNYLVKQKELI